MTIPIRQSTASQEIPLGYFLDSINGDDEKTGLTITNTDIQLWKHGATTVVSKNSGGATHMANGLYYCTLDATDTATLGPLIVFVHVATALAIKVDCEVMTANRFDALVLGTDTLEVDMTQCGGSTVAAGAIPNAAADAAGGLPISDAGALDLDTKLANTNEVTAARMGALTDWIDGGRLDIIIDQILADTDELQGNQGAWLTATGFSTHSAADIWSVVTRALTDKSGFALSATGANLILKDSTFALAMADAIWDEILIGATHNIATSAGRRVREMTDTMVLRGEETAQGGAAGTITLNAAASAIDDFYNESVLIIVGGTGAAQARTIADYNGTTKVVTTCENWRVNPDATSVYVIRGHACSSVYQLSSAVLAHINTECDTALTDYDPSTKTEMDSAFTEVKGATWAAGTDTLEHIRNKQTDIETDTAEIGTAGAGLTDLGGMSTDMATEVNDQVVDVVKTDTTSEMSQAAPPETPTVEEMLAYIYFRLRNKNVETATEHAVYDNAGTTKLFKATMSDSAGEFTKEEYVSGA